MNSKKNDYKAILEDIKTLIIHDVFNYLEGCLPYDTIERLMKKKYSSIFAINISKTDIKFCLTGISEYFKVKK